MTWIQQLLARQSRNATPVASLGFQRLPKYFAADTLSRAKVVYVDHVPQPLLSTFGLSQFATFELMDANGITYLDTFFIRRSQAGDERLHFHELVHVTQWDFLGAKRFVAAYAGGLEQSGYRESPLEVMAYELDEMFQSSMTPFAVEEIVRAWIEKLSF